jgi:hypothetical protein
MDLSNEPAWRKARRSSTNGGDCVELARLPEAIAARDSKDPAGGRLTFTVEAFGAFLADVKTGRLCQPASSSRRS